MQLSIDRLNLQLPPGFEARGEAIARLIGDELSQLPLSGVRQLAHLSLPPQHVHAQASDRQIAGQIARAIHGQLGRGGGHA